MKRMLMLGLAMFSAFAADVMYAQCPGGCCGGRCAFSQVREVSVRAELRLPKISGLGEMIAPSSWGLPAGAVVVSVTDKTTGEKTIYAKNADKGPVEYKTVYPGTVTDEEETDNLFKNIPAWVEPKCEADRVPELKGKEN